MGILGNLISSCNFFENDYMGVSFRHIYIYFVFNVDACRPTSLIKILEAKFVLLSRFVEECSRIFSSNSILLKI